MCMEEPGDTDPAFAAWWERNRDRKRREQREYVRRFGLPEGVDLSGVEIADDGPIHWYPVLDLPSEEP